MSAQRIYLEGAPGFEDGFEGFIIPGLHKVDRGGGEFVTIIGTGEGDNYVVPSSAVMIVAKGVR